MVIKWVVGEDLTKKGESGAEDGESEATWGKSIPGKGNSK